MDDLGVPAHRPRVVMAAMAGLGSVFFTDAQRLRLRGLAHVLDEEPVDDFGSARAAELLGRCDVLLAHWGCPVIDDAVVGAAPDLKLVAYAAGTVKWVVTAAVWQRGIVVTSAAAANAVPVAEYTVAAILLANKGAFVSREWYRNQALRLRRPAQVGNLGKQVGLVGASHVGRLVIERLAPFDLHVAVYDPFLSRAEADALGVRRLDLPELLHTSEVVSLHAPDVGATKGMIGADELALLRDGTTFINTARGALVDGAALEAELATGRISAVLDVTEPEPPPLGSALFELPNVFLTPHLAGAQGTELVRLADLAIDEVERFALGQPPRFGVCEADLDRIA